MRPFLRHVARSGLAGSRGNAEFSRVRNGQRGVRLSLILQPYFITLYSGTGTSMGTGVSGKLKPGPKQEGWDSGWSSHSPSPGVPLSTYKIARLAQKVAKKLVTRTSSGYNI